MSNQYTTVNAADTEQSGGDTGIPASHTDSEQMSRALVHILSLRCIKIKNIFFSLFFLQPVLRTLPWVITWIKNNLF